MAIPGISTNDRERFIVRADEKLTAFLELEAAIRARGDGGIESHDFCADVILGRHRSTDQKV
jgi:hypothetical protein